MTTRGFRQFAVAMLAMASLVGGGSAMADRGGGRHHGGSRAHIGLGFYLGPGFGYPAYPYPAYPYYPSYYPGYYSGYYSGYYPGYYYGPPVVAVPSTPPQYIERDDEVPQSAAAAQPAYWYHCSNPEGYYPYVTRCPGGWRTVPAQPPAR